jgi:DNA-binding LacI/PurR family transcriptional regulator
MTVNLTSSRSSVKLCDMLRSSISAGKVAVGDLVPSVRQLSAKHGLAPKTVHRALRVLAAEGLLAGEPGRGYRVLRRAAPRGGTGPIAYVLGRDPGALAPGDFLERLLARFRAASARRGHSLLVVSHSGRGADEIAEELLAVDCAGVALDTARPELIAAVKAAGLAAVMVDAWEEDSGLDCVMQDGFMGGLLAARHLAAQGCRRIAWFGPIGESAHSRDRFGGAVTGVISAGLDLPPDMRVEAGSSDGAEKAAALMRRADRPDGVIALWRDLTAEVKLAADGCGLKLGKDYHLVGWCPEEIYETRYRPAFGDDRVAPAVVWSAEVMAETTVARLADRRENPGLAPLRVKVPMRLRLPG